MRILLLAVGNKMPAWVEAGFNEYARRLPPQFRLELKEIPPSKRTGRNVEPQCRAEEGTALLKALPPHSRVIALDEHGVSLSSVDLAGHFKKWAGAGEDVTLLIGGPNGLSEECRTRASELWSLSPLTFPHTLVRVIVAEALYRGFSIYAHLPYHRA
ncbi:MAG: 23S rRNA (pseudouridine(1915)-N(3))-methyltransferase RlmH [Succinivibrio sp.]|nr:23S rRNA (pseudouridine(1915)-N(3))-methyltransferase RlmH [Succinivibrio sp.]